MDILPINQIVDEDVTIVGVGLVNLAKLNQFKLSVPDGIVVLPPDFRLRTILKHFDLEHKEVFEQSLEIIKQELIKIPVPGATPAKERRTKNLYESLTDQGLELDEAVRNTFVQYY